MIRIQKTKGSNKNFIFHRYMVSKTQRRTNADWTISRGGVVDRFRSSHTGDSLVEEHICIPDFVEANLTQAWAMKWVIHTAKALVRDLRRVKPTNIRIVELD